MTDPHSPERFPTGSYQAVVAGHICLDVIPDMSSLGGRRLDEILSPGHLTTVGRAAISTGGAVSNTGLALNILGIPTRLMGKIGDDLFGRAVQGVIERYGPGLSEGMTVDPQDSTSYTLIINPPGIDRFFLHFPGANDTFCAADVRYDLVEQARLFHFGYPPLLRRMYQAGGRELVEMLSRIKAMGVTVSLDMSHIEPSAGAGKADWREILSAALPFVDLFLPSIEELLAALHPEKYTALVQRGGAGEAGVQNILPFVTTTLLSDLSRELLDLGVRVAVIKLGDRGLYLRSAGPERIAGIGRAAPTQLSAWADQELWAPCFKVNVAGTTGSGDSSIAGFLSALLRGMGPEEAVTAAAAVGACNVEAPDALSGLRPWDETLKRVAGWARLDFDMPETDWRYDSKRGFWRP